MKFFDTDWNAVMPWLAVWERLSPATRRHYLLAAPGHTQTVSAEGYGAELARVVGASLVVEASPGRYRPSPASVPFRALLAQLAKFPLFDGTPSRTLLEDYTRKHYVRDESDRIQSSWIQPAWDSVAWPKAFLAHSDARAWEKSYLAHLEVYGEKHSPWRMRLEPDSPPKTTWFPNPETAEAARCLVRAALNAPAPLSLNSLPACLPPELGGFFEPALKACLRYLLLYPALRADSLAAVIGLCPTVVFHRTRPPASEPRTEPCDKWEGPAFLLEDMTRVLAEAGLEKCRINQSGYGLRFYKVVEDRFRQDFVPLPPWLERRAEFPRRLDNATVCLSGLGLVKAHSAGGQRWLQATPKGRRWLAQSPADRLRELLSELKRRHVKRATSYDDFLELVPGGVRFAIKDLDDFDHLPWLDSIWRQAPVNHGVAVEAFLDYHARVGHPLSNPVVPDAFRPHLFIRFGSSRFVLREENVEEFARELLAEFFWNRLVPLGCVETGARSGGEACFRLSEAGRYLFGLRQDLAYGQPAGDARVVVQLNFEIVFLHPNLGAEIDFAPFAERCGKKVGTLFRLTRRQVIRAAAQGLTADAALAALARHSSKPVPANVAEELHDWFGGCRKLAMRRAVLIDCPDRETAVRVGRLLGERAAWLGDTRVEWRGAQIDPDRRKKLSDHGLFLETVEKAGANEVSGELDASAHDS